MSTPPERREYKRVPLGLPVFYIRDGAQCLDYSMDIGAGGLRLVADERLTPGTRTQVRFAHPFLGMCMLLEGEVMWTRPVMVEGREASRWAMGIRFHNLMESDALIIDQLVDHESLRSVAGYR